MSLLPKRPLKLQPLKPLQACTMGREHCPVHGFVHGKEAEELRKGIERAAAASDGKVSTRALFALLDRIDARDSLAYLEAKARRRRSP